LILFGAQSALECGGFSRRFGSDIVHDANKIGQGLPAL